MPEQETKNGELLASMSKRLSSIQQNHQEEADRSKIRHGADACRDGRRTQWIIAIQIEMDPEILALWHELIRAELHTTNHGRACLSYRTPLLHPCASTMLSGILIFNQKGENLIFRAFRNDCRPRLADVFRIQVISNAQVRSPILTLGSTTFSHVKHENIYLVAVTKSNANAALVFEFLYRFVGLGKAYFGKFDEEAVKNNFVLVYELLDEILDFGYPQNTETDTLKMYITTEGVKSERAMVRVLGSATWETHANIV